MRNFHKLVFNLNVASLGQSLARQPELWNQHRLRTAHPASPHAQADDIWLRWQDLEQHLNAIESGKAEIEKLVAGGMNHYAAMQQVANAVLDEHESVNYPAFALLPQARPIVYDLMRLVEGERLGRVMITRLAPGKRITPHVDGGTHAAYYDRYHVALLVHPGVMFRAGDEKPQMVTGDVWWFDNSKEHEVINNSAEDRITMIVDIHTAHGRPPT